MIERSIEVFYDIATIPGIEAAEDALGAALDFRNAALDVVEAALSAAGAGTWSGAEIGSGAISVGFDVEDFDAAEAVVRAAVAGTPFAAIREITRFSIDPAICQQYL